MLRAVQRTPRSPACCAVLAFLSCTACESAPQAAAADAGAPTASVRAAPTAAGSVAAPPAIADAVGAVLDDWHDAATKSDEARYFAHFSADGVFMGTDATERWDVPAFRAYAHPHFARGKAWSFRATRRAVMSDAAGQVAWFDEDLATLGLGPARGSGVLRREVDGRWRIAHYNLTITVPNDRFDEVKKLLATPGPDAGSDAGAPPVAGDAAADASGKPIATPPPVRLPTPLPLDSRK